MGAKHFGARVQRLEDPALLAGRGRFVDDVKLPGVLHACFVRSPHAHARLCGIDIKPAAGIPGVHAVLTAADLPEPMRSKPMPMLLLPPLGQLSKSGDWYLPLNVVKSSFVWENYSKSTKKN